MSLNFKRVNGLFNRWIEYGLGRQELKEVYSRGVESGLFERNWK